MKFPVLWSGLCCYTEGWGGKCSEILATIKLLYNPRVNKVFTSIHKFTKNHRHYLRHCSIQTLQTLPTLYYTDTTDTTDTVLYRYCRFHTHYRNYSWTIQTLQTWPWQKLQPELDTRYRRYKYSIQTLQILGIDATRHGTDATDTRYRRYRCSIQTLQKLQTLLTL